MDPWVNATEVYLARLDAEGEIVPPEIRAALYEPDCRICGLKFKLRGMSADARHEHILTCKPAD
jgi:hypothetical protein